MTRDWRDERIAELESQLAERDELIAQLRSELRATRAELAATRAELAELRAKLGQSSRNSSRPPSSDPPWLPRAPKKPPSGRGPGGQPGHEGHERRLLPPEQVDELHELWPEQCERCRRRFGPADRQKGGEPVRDQLVELPPVKPHVTERQMYACCCPDCGWVTTAKLPAGVPVEGFGPRLQATVAVLSGSYGLSKRKVQGLLRDLFRVELSLGAVSACERRTSKALAAPVAEAEEHAQAEAVGYVDETGWRQARARAWVWVLLTRWVTVFRIQAQRSGRAAKALLGRFAGVLVSDRWSAYGDWPLKRRQLCWAHLLRYWTAFAERRGKAGKLGRRLLELTEQMFCFWHRVRDGTMTRSTFRAYMKPVREEVERLLEQGTRCGHAKVAGTCLSILKLAPALWTFVRIEGVEPTNNAAERALRHCVLLRKMCFGTHSEQGSRFIERMLTVHATLRQQGRNVLDYVTEVLEAALRGRKAPSLLPTPAPALRLAA